jgi:D-glycero-D-manno-heptose 1,7-bisphosphate phosphatase
MNQSNLRPALFLDRDGVINHDPNDYTRNILEFTILPGVLEALKRFSDAGYVIIVITNQGGIAKDLYSIYDFYEIDRYMRETFLEAGIQYLDTYFCPHHDAISQCLCRKPHPGMIDKAIAVHGIDRERSFMIGDKFRDVEASEAAGVKGIKVDVNGDLRELVLPAS